MWGEGHLSVDIPPVVLTTLSPLPRTVLSGLSPVWGPCTASFRTIWGSSSRGRRPSTRWTASWPLTVPPWPDTLSTSSPGLRPQSRHRRLCNDSSYRYNCLRKQERKEKKKKKESERDDVKIWSVLFRAVKHCLMFNGAVCVCQSFYNQISQEKETNADTFLILNFIFFFYYCVGLLILLFSGWDNNDW